MSVNYQVRVKNRAGALQAIVTHENVVNLSFGRVVNGVGWHELTVGIEQGDLFVQDGQIEIWRNVDDAGWALEYEGFHRDGIWRTDHQMIETFLSRGTSYNDLLVRRCIAEYAGTAGASKNGVAETVAKAFVTEQLVSPTLADRQMAELTVQADAATGNVVRIERAYRNVLEVLQETARIGGGDFDIVGTGANAYQFRWYNGQRGTDRRTTIVFSTAYGNMLAPTMTIVPPTSNMVLVIGEGEGVARIWSWRPAVAPTGMDRREIVRDARDTDNVTVMERRGDAELERHRGYSGLTFQAAQTMAHRYGVHYSFGDLVRAWYRGTAYDMQIIGVDITIGAIAERVGITLEDV